MTMTHNQGGDADVTRITKTRKRRQQWHNARRGTEKKKEYVNKEAESMYVSAVSASTREAFVINTTTSDYMGSGAGDEG